MTRPYTDYVTVDDLRQMSPADLEKYRPSSWAKILVSLSLDDLERLGADDPDEDGTRWGERKYPLRRLARQLLPELRPEPGLGLDEHRQHLHRRDEGDWHREQIDNGMDLAERILSAPGLARAVHALTDEAEERSVGRGDIARFVTEQHLKALQLFTYAARVPPGEIRTAEEYGYAMSFFLARGDRPSAAVMRSFAYYSGAFTNREKYLTGGDIHEDHARWAGRHRYWQDHARAARSPEVGEGRARRGADGSSYVLNDRAVTIRTAGGGTETVAFESQDAAAEWAANRTLAGTGPLFTTAGGPACRTAREDEILARLLRAPDDAGLRACTDSDMFTSHLRAELHQVLVLNHPDGARARFADALLRAPGWALGDIGFPDAHRALRYLDRLQATPVSEAQARDAALTVRAARDQADHRLFEDVADRRPPSKRRVSPPCPAAEPRKHPLLPPPPPLPGSGGPAPRLLSDRIRSVYCRADSVTAAGSGR